MSLPPDLRYALRTLTAHKGFSLMALVCLALGLSANAAIFGALKAFLFLQLPFEDSDRIALVWSINRDRGSSRSLSSDGDFFDWRQQNQSFESLVAFRSASYNLSEVPQPVRLSGTEVSWDFFELLGIRPSLGRPFRPEDGRAGAEPVVVLSHSLWQSAFGGDSEVVGRNVKLDGQEATVVGVMPPDFWFLGQGTQLWRPLTLDASQPDRGRRFLGVMARLKSGASIERVQAELDQWASRAERAYPATNRDWGAAVVPLREEIRSNLRIVLVLLYGAAGLMLLIVCANLANLFLARALSRRREIAVRKALGAGRWAILRQLLVESLLLSATAGVAAIPLATWLTALLRSLFSGRLPFLAETVQVEWSLLAYMLAVSLATGLAFGAAPALRASRFDLNLALEGNLGLRAGSGRTNLSRLLIVSETALAVVLVFGVGLFVRSLTALESIELGFNPDRLLTLRLTTSETNHERLAEFYRRVLERLPSLSGVVQAAAIDRLPLAGSKLNPTQAVVVDGRPSVQQLLADELVASPDYFAALEIPLPYGRPFSEQDRLLAPPVAIINRTMADRFWPAQSPLGQRFKFGDLTAGTPWITVVGVVNDIVNDDRDAPPVPQVYRPIGQRPLPSMSVVVRTSGDPLGLIEPIRSQIQAVDPSQPIYDVQTMDRVLYEDLAGSYILVGVLASLAGLALGLACLGLFGVMAYLAQRRRYEIGIRMALGAGRGRILRWMVAQGLQPVGIGIAVGLIAAAGIGRLFSSQLYGVGPFDIVTAASTVLILTASGLLAGAFPAWRASRTDPLLAIRAD